MNTFYSKNIRWLILSTLVVLWGSSFILMKRSLVSFSPVQVGLLRMSFASFVLIPFAFKHIKKISLQQWILLFVVGLIGNSIPAYLFSKAQTGIDSSLAGVLNATTPFFVLLVGLLFFQLKVSWINLTGLILGLLGAVQIIGLSGIGNFAHNIHYSWYIILATILYAINLNLIKYKLPGLDSKVIAIFSISLVGIPSFVLLFTATPFVSNLQSEVAVINLIYPAILGIFCSSIALIMFYKLIQLTGVVFSSSVTYLIPVVALFLGVLDGEEFKILNLLWIAIIIFGVYLVNLKKKSESES